MSLTIRLNTGAVDGAVGAGGVTFTDISIGNDFLIFTAGSSAVANGQPIPSSFQLSQAGIVLTGSDIIVPHVLLADISANQLKESTLMGNANHRYVLAFDFSGATTSEPILEAWDNSSLNTTDFASLGAGTPSSSWLHGVTTTDALPGASWVGNTLAGSSDTHFLWLNNQNGALSGAGILYCNLYLKVPATQVAGGAETPILVVKFTTT